MKFLQKIFPFLFVDTSWYEQRQQMLDSIKQEEDEIIAQRDPETGFTEIQLIKLDILRLKYKDIMRL